MILHGMRYARGAHESLHGTIEITGDRISRILHGSHLSFANSGSTELDLTGFLVMPGLINAHDHLQFALFPRMSDSIYANYIEWGEDIHSKFPDVIAKHRAVPKEVRVWWGGIRNLLCGVTTVSHHNPLWPELQRRDFPVRVVQKYGWAHSVALGGDLAAARAATPDGRAFIVHACEGVDEQARKELWELDQIGLLDARAVLVHCLAIDDEGIRLMRDRNASLVVCPSSNHFLFGKVPRKCLFEEIDSVAIGNDSPLTAEGDLLDEIRFAIDICAVSPESAYRMVTEAPAKILQLENIDGCITESGAADLIAIRDTGEDAADRLQSLSMHDVEFVVIGGRVQLASEAVMERLPLSAKPGLEPLSIDGTMRWLRAPVEDLLQKAEDLLGSGEVRLGSRSVGTPTGANVDETG
ncbi:MAG: amidohydrolase family protein [Candidatus Sulfotelmatobacter sp.]